MHRYVLRFNRYARSTAGSSRTQMRAPSTRGARFRHPVARSFVSSNHRVILNIRSIDKCVIVCALKCVRQIFTERNCSQGGKEFEKFTTLNTFQTFCQFTSSWNFSYSHNCTGIARGIIMYFARKNSKFVPFPSPFIRFHHAGTKRNGSR